MDNTKRLEQLNQTAIDFFNSNNYTQVAIAVSGSEESLVLLNAATFALGNINVFVVVADTGYLSDKRFKVIEAACNLVNVQYSIVPVEIQHDRHMQSSVEDTAEYKEQVISALTHEAWLFGYEILACACTDDSCRQSGNDVIFSFDSVICPFIKIN